MDVDKMQTKLAVWAKDPDFRFDDIYNLLYDRDWLRRAYQSVAANSGAQTAGVDRKSISDFEEDLEENLTGLRRSLKAEEYAPSPVRRTYVPKGDGRTRPLGIPTIRDRIVQEGLRMILEPIYETDFSPWSYGFRPNRRTHDAIMAAYTAMSESAKMFWVIDADIEGFFDNLDHQRLEQVLQDRIRDGKLRDLIWAFLKAGVMEEGTYRHSMTGTPQGGIVSPVLANIYLDGLDQWARRFTDRSRLERKRARNKGKGNWRYVRYADDFLLLTNGRRRRAEKMVGRLREQINDRLNLTLSWRKTKIVHANDGFEFLGYRLKRKKDGDGGKAIRLLIPDEAKTRFRKKVKAATGGSHDVSARAKIRALNAVVRGWGTYYKYAADAPRAFSDLDNFVWWKLMGWLTKKYRVSVRKVIENRLDRRSPLTVNGKSLTELSPMGMAIYTGSFRKDEHPYLTEMTRKREELPEENPWLINLKERPGWEDQRWQALQRDGWTCQQCGTGLSKANAEVHHERASTGYSNPGDANRLENLTSLCERCHKEIESERTHVK